MKKLFFLLLFPFISFGQVLPNYEIKEYSEKGNTSPKTEITDTLFFNEIYNFYGLPDERFSQILLSSSFSKYFLLRIMCGRYNFSDKKEISPKSSIWDQDGHLTMSEDNFLNLDNVSFYSKKDMEKIYFLPKIKNTLFYKYINNEGEMDYFELEVFHTFNKWQISARKADKKHNLIKGGTNIILPTYHQDTTAKTQ